MFLLFKVRWFLICVVVSLVVAMSLAAGLVLAVVNYLRGYRNQEAGLLCDRCHKRAFPVGTYTRQYRCSSCDHRFAGPRHST